MHECDKDDRLKILEAENAKLIRNRDIVKILLTPKMILSITIALSVLIQTLANIIGG